MLANKLMSALSGEAEDRLYVDDVFSAYTRTGTGADVTVPTGIDMTKGYMLWSKGRSGTTDHAIYDSARGVTYDLASNLTAAQTIQATGLKAVSTSGHTVGSLAKMNTNAASYVDFVFRKASKFFDVVTYTGNGVSNRRIPHSLGISPGFIVVKGISGTFGESSWIVYHQALGGTDKILRLNTTVAAASYTAGGNFWGDASGHTDTDFGVSSDVYCNDSGTTYVAYLFAHDPSADGFIQCGSYTGNGSATGPIVTLGWEPQYLMIKNVSGTGNWQIIDNMRGMAVGSVEATLQANLTAAESSADYVSPLATGFQITSTSSEVNTSGSTYIYMVIRRPNKPPTTGTEVFQAVNYAGNGGVNSISAGSMKSVDTAIWYSRNLSEPPCILNRMLGVGASMETHSTGAEATFAGGPYFDVLGGLRFTNGSYNSAGNQGMWCFKRAPGFFDMVCDTGTGATHTVAHNLAAVPELIIRKKRSAADNWVVYAGAATDYLLLNTTAATADLDTMWNDTPPTSSVFTVGSNDDVNQSTGTFATYLFASLAGVSKVGTYTGNGSSQTINCGFGTGARFILIKRTDSTGDWYAWDHTNGIISGNDPHISLNSAANPVTTDDSVDPDNSGFSINQNAATNINVSGGQYIFLSVA